MTADWIETQADRKVPSGSEKIQWKRAKNKIKRNLNVHLALVQTPAKVPRNPRAIRTPHPQKVPRTAHHRTSAASARKARNPSRSPSRKVVTSPKRNIGNKDKRHS